MMQTPDGHGRLELTKFRNPKLVEIEPAIAAEHAGPSQGHVCRRKRRRHCRSPTRQRRRTRRRGGAVRGQVQTLLHARPRGHHRRAGRGTLLKRSLAFGGAARRGRNAEPIGTRPCLTDATMPCQRRAAYSSSRCGRAVSFQICASSYQLKFCTVPSSSLYEIVCSPLLNRM